MAEIEIGILTRGKPTLGMTLSSLLLQQVRDIRIYIVDTSETPVIHRDDVAFALRLAFDRRIPCNYEFLREKDRAFSRGRLRILESLKGRNICFMDDDIVLPSSSLARLLEAASSMPEYGFIAPYCQHSTYPADYSSGKVLYTPGSIFYQDQATRQVLIDYYRTTVDLLDRKQSPEKVWEPAFLSHVFPALGRPCQFQKDNVIYHLDYGESVNWDAFQEQVAARSEARARELVGSLR